MVKALTFDLWDTVIHDDSDEPKRAKLGLPSKALQRRILTHTALLRHAPTDRAIVDAAYDTCDQAFRQVWYGLSVTWTVRERLGVLLKGLKRELPEPEFAELIRAHEDMELEIQPDPVPGVIEALKAVKGKYRIGVISDAIFTPGRNLRKLLALWGVADVFDHFVFSDEVGCSKPDPRCFHEAAKGLGVAVPEIVHVGDRVEKDVDGAVAAGARAILLPITRKPTSSPDRAAAVCDDYRKFADIVAAL